MSNSANVSTATTTTVLAKPPVLSIYDLRNYTFNSDTKEPQYEKDKTVQARLQRFKEIFDKTGMRRSVFGVLLVNHNLYPAVLLLKIGNSSKGFYKLPGGRCRPNESEMDCLKRKLTRRLAPDDMTANWNIKECISVWYRPAFETYLYPYIPAHVSQPKECMKIYLIELPEKYTFSIPKNLFLTAFTLMDIYDNSKTFGPIISSIPQTLSRYSINIVASRQQMQSSYQ